MEGIERMNEIINQVKVDQATMAVRELVKCAEAIDMAYLHMGKMLLFIKENELYKYYSEHTQTMSSFLREIDIGIGVSQADHYIRVYKTFGDKLEGRKISFKRLLLIHPLVGGSETIDHLLDMAAILPLRALNDEIRERQGRTPSDSCAHPTDAIKTFCKCSICGQWLKEVIK
jgi:hypothetical protein